MTYAYARVSSKDQNEARQIDAFHAQGIEDAQIFVDKESGKDFNRRGYMKLKRLLKNGDLMVVMSLDRFGRDYEGIKEEWAYITKKKGANIKVLDMPILDTTSGSGLIGRFISDLVLSVLGFVAEEERKHIKERQAQGIAAAKARGVRFGRLSMERPDNFSDVADDWVHGKIGIRTAGERLGTSSVTFRKWCREDGLVQVVKRKGGHASWLHPEKAKKRAKRRAKLVKEESENICRIRRDIFSPIAEDKPLKELI